MEIPNLWRFFRNNNVYPNVERVTSVGRASMDMVLSSEEVYWLYETLREIDEKEFGIEWYAPFSAIPNHSCFIFLSGCHISAQGDVCICPEMQPMGNIKRTPLSQILQKSPFKEARLIDKLIEPPCSTCHYLHFCLGGCRSKAINCQNGTIFSMDPKRR